MLGWLADPLASPSPPSLPGQLFSCCPHPGLVIFGPGNTYVGDLISQQIFIVYYVPGPIESAGDTAVKKTKGLISCTYARIAEG